jgi:hypothetical protein
MSIGVARAHAATMSSAAFRAGALATKWTLDSGDCAGSVSISDSPAVDSYGFFTGWHAAWGGDNCLATSNVEPLDERAGTYSVQGHALPPGFYYAQVSYCRDSDFSGAFFCHASNSLTIRIPSPVAGTISHLTGKVLVDGTPVPAGTRLTYGDEVVTGAGARATVNLSGGAQVELGESTTLIPWKPASARIRSGRARATLTRFFRISSPNAAATASGGTFRLAVSRNWTRARTNDGSVAFSNTGGTQRTVNVAAGYESTVRGSNPPSAPRRF